MRRSAKAGVLGIILIATACVGHRGARPELTSAAALDPVRDDQVGPYASGRTGPIHVGAIFDIAGATGETGEPYSVGARHYLEHINASGGVEGVPIRLWWGDYQSDAAVAEQLYSDFKGRNVVAIIGWGPAGTEALEGHVGGDEVPYLSGSLSDELLPVEPAPYRFTAGTTCSAALPTCALDAGERTKYARAHGHGHGSEFCAAYLHGWYTAELLAEAIAGVIRSGSQVTGAAIRQALQELAA